MSTTKENPRAKDERNLDELVDTQIKAIAEKLKIKFDGKDIDWIKKAIRTSWANKGIKEMPFAAIANKMEEKKFKEPKKIFKSENYTFEKIFTPEEVQDKAKELARMCDEKNKLEDAKKSMSSDFKSRIDSKTAEINIVSQHISTGREHLYKSCNCWYDYDSGYKIYFYEEKEVGRHKMSKGDYQLQFPTDN